MTAPELPQTVPISALAELFGVSTRQARNLCEGAKVKSAVRGQWPLASSVRAVLAHAREAREPDALSAARARALNAKARSQEIALARQERELVPVEEFTFAMDIISHAVVEALNGLPSRVTRDLEVRRKIEAELHAARQQMASKLKATAAELRQGMSELEDA